MRLAGMMAGLMAVSGCTSHAGGPWAAERSGTSGSVGDTAPGGDRVTIATYAAADGSTSTAVLTGAIGDYGPAKLSPATARSTRSTRPS